jgi:ribonuclease PH
MCADTADTSPKFVRPDGRQLDQLRPISISRNYLKWPEGSVLIAQGNTKVIVTASVEEGVPRFLKDSGKGWITSEYDMLPRATDRRTNRSRDKGGIPGRTQEIQRLIGRAIRAGFDHEHLGEITIKIDADVIQADGGTRCASITGAFVAVYDALQKAVSMRLLPKMPAFKPVAAISVGIIKGSNCLDLCYEEDSNADVDMNIIMDDTGNLIEIQGTAERQNFSRTQLNQLLDLGQKGITEILAYLKSELKY